MDLKIKDQNLLWQIYINTFTELKYIYSLIEKFENHFNSRSDRWQESKKGQRHLEIMETLESAKDGVNETINNIEYVLELLEIDIPK